MYSIVVPAYKEQGRIGKTLEELSHYFELNKILVICDNDVETCNVAREKGATIYNTPQRLGKGGSLKEGLKMADGQVIIFLDADLPVSPDKISEFLTIVKDYDLVIFKRRFSELPLLRKLLHEAFKFVVKLFFPSLIGVKDFQAGFKIIKRDKVNEVINELIINDFLFDVNLIYAFKRRGFKIKEIPVEWKHEEKDSKISSSLLKIILLMFLSVIKLRVYYSPFKPLLRTKLYLKAESAILNKLRS
ncbi:dolichyl-phosphate mannose synthase [Sulfolobales archaeon HS-7]|nr:dolichyl-phosphate mannose synthase [Sulfolobales archaeon HS-7]